MGQETQALPHDEVINLDAYPISDTGSSDFAALVKGLRHRLDSQQYVVLPDFIGPAAREQAVAQIQDAFHLAGDVCGRRYRAELPGSSSG